MEDVIRKAIEFQARKILRKEEKQRFANRKYQRKHKLRTGSTPLVSDYREPSIWGVAPHFNPRYCITHSKFLAKVIWLKIRSREFEPQPAIRYRIAKDTGGFREIMVFSIPDSAIANLFYRRLRDKNRNLFSPFSYAYMKDRGLFDAVIQLRSFLDGGKKYVIQFDFAKYFDSIDHKYLEHLFEITGFNLSNTELYLMRSFLKHKIFDSKNYGHGPAEIRRVGVPQGSSLSLFLANLAGHQLDRRLESTNGQFVRFADDIVAVTNNHNDALQILSAFDDHCEYSGISINHQKSPGISILATDVKSEMRSFYVNNGDGDQVDVIEEFDYIGHKFSKDEIQLSSRGIKKTKRRLSRIIYIHLLYSLKSLKKFDKSRVVGSHFDWDLVTCVNEIRKFIYGGLREHEIRSFLDRNQRLGKFRGFIAFCPLISSVDQFAELDGWLVSVIKRALKERYRLVFAMKGKPVVKEVPNFQSLLSGQWYDGPSKLELELGLPSFVLAWRASRKKYKQYGLDDFENPQYYSLVSETGGSNNLYDV